MVEDTDERGQRRAATQFTEPKVPGTNCGAEAERHGRGAGARRIVEQRLPVHVSALERRQYFMPTTAAQLEHETTTKEGILEHIEPSPRSLTLPSGRTIEASNSPAGERVQIRSADGMMEVAIRFEASGPVLEVRATSLAFEAEKIALRCEELTTEVRGDSKVTVGGNLDELVRGRRRLASLGPTALSGRDVDVTADAGELRAASRDDLTINGKNVLINC